MLCITVRYWSDPDSRVPSRNLRRLEIARSPILRARNQRQSGPKAQAFGFRLDVSVRPTVKATRNERSRQHRRRGRQLYKQPRNRPEIQYRGKWSQGAPAQRLCENWACGTGRSWRSSRRSCCRAERITGTDGNQLRKLRAVAEFPAILSRGIVSAFGHCGIGRILKVLHFPADTALVGCEPPRNSQGASDHADNACDPKFPMP